MKERSREKSLLLLYFYQADAIIDINNILNPPPPPDPPNDVYQTENLGTWSSISDVDNFFSRFNYSNGYKDGDVSLALGNTITIQDGTYNTTWMIAGFNMEKERTAHDQTIYDNGYGISLVPVTQVTANPWNSKNTYAGGYISSAMHRSCLPIISSNLQNVLGSHLIERSVLLSDNVNGNISSGYTWTKAYATLMSLYQVAGVDGYRSAYDVGESNYKLPVFDYSEYKTGSGFWVRNIWGNNSQYWFAWYVKEDGSFGYGAVQNSIGVRPMIYIG